MPIIESSLPEARILDPLELELSQRHLIEASAGTGKTFNITRLYARLILEKKLAVQEILVMTFTKAATEEIRGRVATFLQEIHDEWHADKRSDFTKALQTRVDIGEGDALLTAALLSLDEASIFTIHGFCQRVLKQFAVTLSTDLEPELITDASEITMQAIQDWLRVLARDDLAFELLSSKKWHVPEQFYAEFSGAIASEFTLKRVSSEDLAIDHISSLSLFLHTRKNEIIAQFTSLKSLESVIFDAVVLGNKDEDKRRKEWQGIVAWFTSVIEYLNRNENENENENENKKSTTLLANVSPDSAIDDHIVTKLMQLPKEMGDFINGNRFRQAKEVSTALQPLKDFRATFNKFYKDKQDDLHSGKQLNAILEVVEQGIYAVRNSIDKAKRQAQVVGFDDLIRLLSGALQSNEQPGKNENLVEAIRKQFPVALVDEFQDTDKHQYQILDQLYPKADNNSLLLMIGDPKQAIYGFRGGDIFVYLEAKKQADHIWIMDTNWRSSAHMVTGYNRLFWGHSLQEQLARPVFGFDIEYELIKSTELSNAAKSPLFDPAPARSALTYMLSSDAPCDKQSSKKSARRKKAELDKQVLDWTALEIMRLLADVKIAEKKLVPADIAILVRGKSEAKQIRERLDNVGLTAVYLSDKTPLFESSEAVELYRVLDAILHSRDSSALMAGTSSSLLSRVIGKDESIFEHQQKLQEIQNDLMHPLWENITLACLAYKAQWFKEGIFSLVLKLIKENYEPSTASERSLTNMMHLAEALAKNAVLNKLPEQQLAWFSHQIFNHGIDEEMQLRLESDANLIKIVTQHGAKGLEYPIVFVPFANNYKNPSKRRNSKIQHFKYQDVQNGQSIYQLGTTSTSLNEYVKQAHAEEMRLLYVAVTRAEYRCYLGMVDDAGSHNSALNSALGIPENVLNVYQPSEEAHTELNDWLTSNAVSHTASDSGARINTLDPNSCIVDVDQKPVAINVYSADAKEAIPIFESADLCNRSAWIISSFSNLSRFQAASDNDYYDVALPNQISLHAMESTREHQVNSTSPSNPLSSLQGADKSADKSADIESPNAIRYQLEKGADTGNLLHDILEQVNFNEPDWETASSAALTKYKALEEGDIQALYSWLDSCLKTPLQDGFCMADLVKANTLREAEFYFPMPNLKVSQIATVLNAYRQHIFQQRGFESLTLSMPNIPELTGMMHGFIDLIFEYDGKFYVADYKSTHLGESPQDYSSAKLHENNQHHLYDLQYLLYSLALHKYLKQQIPDYSFERDFGGVYYLYLRGMSPQQSFQGESTGVFFDKVEMKFIDMLEKLFNLNTDNTGKEL